MELLKWAQTICLSIERNLSTDCGKSNTGRHGKATCVTLEVRIGIFFSSPKKSLDLEQSNMKCNQTQLKLVCLFIQGQLRITEKYVR